MLPSDDASDLTRTFNSWLFDGLAAPNATFSVYLIGNSYDTARRIYTVAVPDFAVGQKAAFLLGGRNELPKLSVSAAGKDPSAIAEAISVSTNELRERHGRHQLVILSDMRQYSPRTWNFEDSVPVPERFVAWLKRENLFVNLQGIPVTIWGLHNHRSKDSMPYDANLDLQLRKMWEAALQAMGAADIEMHTGLTEASFTP